MDKLELKHLAKMLPYGVKFLLPIESDRIEDYVVNCGWHFTHTLQSAIQNGYDDAISLSNIVLTQKEPFISIEDNELFLGQMVTNFGNDEDDVFLKEVKPILFPLSAITQEITIKGRMIIPIIEILMKTSLFDLSQCMFEVYTDDNIVYVNAEEDRRVIDSMYYDYNIFYNMNNNGPYNPTNPQSYPQELLLELHFDVDGLIERNLAISVFDLPQNPYA